MERKIGDKFEDNDVWLEVVEDDNNPPCIGCHYEAKNSCSRHFEVAGQCTAGQRTDKTDVKFKKLKMKTEIEELENSLSSCRMDFDNQAYVFRNKIQSIENEIEKLKEKEEKKEFPQEGDTVYPVHWNLTYSDSNKVPYGSGSEQDKYINYFKKLGLLAKSQEEQTNWQRDRAKRKQILDRIKELNGDWKSDFDGDNTNFCIVSDKDKFNITSYCSIQHQPLEHYFKFKTIGAQLIAEFGEDLKVLSKLL